MHIILIPNLPKNITKNIVFKLTILKTYLQMF